MFDGVHTAIITPFKNGSVDLYALRRLIERQIDAGIDGLVACGTTGESATLSEEETLAVIKETISAANGRVNVIAGVGSNNTAKTIRIGQRASELGADGLLVITPYYNKPTQQGLINHFKAVSDAVPTCKIMLYNVPGRTGVSLSLDTVKSLSEVPNIVALKEATGDMAFAARIVADCGSDLTVLSGDDLTALPLWAIGGRGIVSVTSNLVPSRMVEMWQHYQSGHLSAARRVHHALLPLFDGLFIESNPIPIKTLVAKYTDCCERELRLPMTPLSSESEIILHEICQRLEIGSEPS